MDCFVGEDLLAMTTVDCFVGEGLLAMTVGRFLAMTAWEDSKSSNLGAESSEEFVVDVGVFVGEGFEGTGFACIGITDQSYCFESLFLSPLSMKFSHLGIFS